MQFEFPRRHRKSFEVTTKKKLSEKFNKSESIEIFEVIKKHKGPIISESGIKTADDAKYIYEKTGIKNFLIGESLLKSDKPDELMKELIQITQ